MITQNNQDIYSKDKLYDLLNYKKITQKYVGQFGTPILDREQLHKTFAGQIGSYEFEYMYVNYMSQAASKIQASVRENKMNIRSIIKDQQYRKNSVIANSNSNGEDKGRKKGKEQ